MRHPGYMDLAISTLLSRVDALHGAAHWDEVLREPADRTAKDAAIAMGELIEPYHRLLVRPGTERSIVRARHFRGRLTCASAAQALGYPMWSPPSDLHIAVPANHSVRPSASRPLAGVHIHRPATLTPMTVDNFPLVRPAEVVACALVCLDELDAICIADAALNHGDTTKEDIAELLVGRYSKNARLRLSKADAAARSHLETRTRLCLREAGLQVETGVVLEGVGEVDTLVEGWLIVEEDEYEFHSSKKQFARDRNRDQSALAAGYVPLRLTYDDVAAGERTILGIVGRALRGVAHSSRLRIPENRAILRNLGWT